MNKETNINERIKNEIIKVLSQLEFLYESESVFIKKHLLPGFISWIYIFNNPKNKQQNYYFLIPEHSNITIDSLSIKYNYYIINVYNSFEENENIVSPNNFYRFLFNLDGYEIFLKTDNEFSMVRDLYVDRSINIRIDEDVFENTTDNISKNLFDSWVEKKSVNPILTLGDRGMGKSWTIKEFCLRQFEKHKTNPWINSPAIYLNLKTFSDQLKTSLFEAIIFQIRKLYNIKMLSDYYVWEAFVSTGKIIIVLDGLDEMSQEIDFNSKSKHLWEIFNITDKTTRVILTSRTSYFSSQIDIYKYFSHTKYESYVSVNSRPITDTSLRLRNNFNVWEIERFKEKEIAHLSDKYVKSNSKRLHSGIEELNKILNTTKVDTIEHELKELTFIPAFFNKLVNLLTHKGTTLIQIYEKCLLSAAIRYNIDTDRALKSIRHKVGDEIIRIKFNAEKKMEILQELAWFMFERNQRAFELDKLPHYIKNIYGYDYDIIINDLRTQTLIKLKEDTESEFEFISDGVFSFLIASHLVNKLDKNINEGIVDIGSYNIIANPIGYRIITFLIEFFAQSEVKVNLFNKIKENFKIDKPYCPWHRYLSINLKPFYKNNINDIENLNAWTKTPLKDLREDMVLIPGNKKASTEPFFISQTEITNNQFNKFITDTFGNKQNKYRECKGKYWKRKSNKPNPFKNLINDYHLFYWIGNDLPQNEENHPVVYISWFAAAAYCNWLSISENKEPYYNFKFINDLLIVENLNAESDSYRLPSGIEWEFSAREGDYDKNYNHPWDKQRDSFNELSEKGVKLMSNLLERQSSTDEVKDEKANIFGVYGLIGNVREWINSDEPINLESKCKIRGATWLLGEKGFKFEHFNEVLAQNTNLDVGFRIAKSTSKDDKIKINRELNLQLIKE